MRCQKSEATYNDNHLISDDNRGETEAEVCQRGMPKRRTAKKRRHAHKVECRGETRFLSQAQGCSAVCEFSTWNPKNPQHIKNDVRNDRSFEAADLRFVQYSSTSTKSATVVARARAGLSASLHGAAGLRVARRESARVHVHRADLRNNVDIAAAVHV